MADSADRRDKGRIVTIAGLAYCRTPFGLVFVPSARPGGRKHDCADCKECAFCSDDRCGVCRREQKDP
jgi:hypothetical protein